MSRPVESGSIRIVVFGDGGYFISADVAPSGALRRFGDMLNQARRAWERADRSFHAAITRVDKIIKDDQ